MNLLPYGLISKRVEERFDPNYVDPGHDERYAKAVRDYKRRPQTIYRKEWDPNNKSHMNDMNNEQVVLKDSLRIPPPPRLLTVEEQFQRKNLLEHILLRPETYIGSIRKTEKNLTWVYDLERDCLVNEEISYVPGLLKIFDEILVNAADHQQRSEMTLIKVYIDTEANKITVYNNGEGIPVNKHPKEKVYIPELIFGSLLTSSNYNDDEKKKTGGCNGYGAKLCNIFSQSFIVETASQKYNSRYRQKWHKNMVLDGDPIIDHNFNREYTRIIFKPDLIKFGMTKLDDDIVRLMSRRVSDIAATTGLNVYLDGEKLRIPDFKSYISMFLKAAGVQEYGNLLYEKLNDNWEIGLSIIESGSGLKTNTYVNGISTINGGTHVEEILKQIASRIASKLYKKLGSPTKISYIKPFIWLFVNCKIENPTFESQCKTELTTEARHFQNLVLSEGFIEALANSTLIDLVVARAEAKKTSELIKDSQNVMTRIRDIPKLDDALEAGGVNGHKCTLILTEGDSAKALAVAGIAEIGRKYYGIFPLRGKPINARQETFLKISKNAEIQAIVKILGLSYRKNYAVETNYKSLRYGKLMIMADQDQDGSHIKGLIINFIQYYWPSLFKRNFLEQFITPIIKATKDEMQFSFYSLGEFNEWKNDRPDSSKFQIKYYKGLGTSTAKEAKEYFSAMDRHRIRFVYRGRDDDQAMDLAFLKDKVEERRDWLTKWTMNRKERRAKGLPDDYLYTRLTRCITYKSFIDRELITYSNADNERSIPSLIDGLKPGQRKVIYSCFKRNDTQDVKVAQLAGSVSEVSAYHHGEASLMGTIVNLAQDYVGSNNLNLLLPIGQFGTRLQGGKDSASPRYIFTKLNPLARLLFPASDDNILKFQIEDNQSVEPEWYYPIIPLVLVNGCSGIGTGWSTNIPNFRPTKIAKHILHHIKNRSHVVRPLIPWYKGFRGEIKKLDKHHFVSFGEVAILGNDTIEITELPVKIWTQSYKESVLIPMMEPEATAIIRDCREYHTDTTVRFVINFYPGKLEKLQNQGLHKALKLRSVISSKSMVLFDENGVIRRYESPEEIALEFFKIRKQKYIERVDYVKNMLKAQRDYLLNQVRFIQKTIEKEFVLESQTYDSLLAQFISSNFEPNPIKKWENEQKQSKENINGTYAPIADEKKGMSILADFEYLISLPISSLSREGFKNVKNEFDKKSTEYTNFCGRTWQDLWEEDLDRLTREMSKQENLEMFEREDVMKAKFEEGVGDIYPSPTGQRVPPVIDRPLLIRYERKILRPFPRLDSDDSDVEVLGGIPSTSDEAERKRKLEKDAEHELALSMVNEIPSFPINTNVWAKIVSKKPDDGPPKPKKKKVKVPPRTEPRKSWKFPPINEDHKPPASSLKGKSIPPLSFKVGDPGFNIMDIRTWFPCRLEIPGLSDVDETEEEFEMFFKTGYEEEDEEEEAGAGAQGENPEEDPRIVGEAENNEKTVEQQNADEGNVVVFEYPGENTIEDDEERETDTIRDAEYTYVEQNYPE